MKGLNLSGFKKIHDDGHTVVMKHHKGHEIKIAVKVLPKFQQEQIKRIKMDDGGEVNSTSDSTPNTPVPIDPDKAKSAQDSMRKAFGFAKGGKVKHYDDGGSVSNDDPSTANSTPGTVINVNATPPPQSPVVNQANLPVNVPQIPVTPKAPAPLLPNGSMSAPGAAQMGQQATNEQSQIDQAKAQAMVPVEQAKIDAQKAQAQRDQENINELRTHADNLANNLKDIDPNRYKNNMSDSSKVATGIGLFLGGLSVPFHGTNFAQDFMNKQIDRDIDAQKTNNEKQKTVWGAYNSLYNNQNVASAMAKASMADIYANQVSQIAAKLGTPQAIQKAHEVNAGLAITRNKAILDAAGNLSSIPNNPSSKSTPAPNTSQQGNINIAPTSYEPGSQSIVASPKPVIEPDEYADSGILAPNAQARLDGLRYTPKAKEELGDIKNQYTAAQQADTILGQLHEVHQNMYNEAKKGGTSGYFRRHDPADAVPYVGHAMSNLFTKPVTDTQNNREYDTNKTRLISDIANALRGTNVGGGDIQAIVDANSPEHGDTPEMAAKKERAIRVFIKNSVPKSLLKDWGLAK